MAAHCWTDELGTYTHYYATPSSPITSTNTSIAQVNSDFAADFIHESTLGIEPRHASICYSPHVAIDESTGLWPAAGAYPAGPDVLIRSEALSGGAQSYADWFSDGGTITHAQEGVTLLSAHESMCSFG